jgi:zinc protease
LLMLFTYIPLGAHERAQVAAGPQAPALAAQSQELPAARAVIERHVRAVGGREAALAYSSQYAKGSVTMASAAVTGTVEVFAAKPNRMLTRINLAGIGELQEGFDGTVAWSMSPLTGPALVEGKQLEERKFDADYYGEVHTADRYESIATLERTIFDGRPCYKVKLVRRGGNEDIHYYDIETGLKAGMVATRETPMGPLNSTSTFSEYRRFGKLLQATKMTQNVMGIQQVITLTAFEYDTVDPGVFEPPAPIKALLK